MQRNFDLYIVRPNFNKLITSYAINTAKSTNLYSTFDEHISFQQHDQITFTFSMMRNVSDTSQKSAYEYNSLLKLLTIGTKMRLVEDGVNQYDLIIKDIEPTIHKQNACYKFTCQDEVSYRWSRIKLGYSYSTIDKGGPRDIYTIAQEILGECNLDTWDVVTISNVIAAYTPLSGQKITFEVTNSNPYNAIIEACNSVNAQLSVDYTNKTLTFYQNNNRPFSGYRYRPELNLSNLGASYSGENMATILHVTGGTDEHDANITMVPYMPVMLQKHFTTNTAWQTQDHHEWWYSDIIYPVYWRHLTGNQTINQLESILNNSTLRTDIEQGKMPASFEYFDYDAYVQEVKTKYTTVETYNQYISEMQQLYEAFYLEKVYTAQTVSAVPEEYAAYYTLEKYNNAIIVQQQQEMQEYQNFVKVANKHPHLGQFLFDFGFFVKSGLLTADQHSILLNKFNKEMRNNNIWLKIYTQQYYTSLWELNQHLIDIKSLLEQANAWYSAIYEKWEQSMQDSTINMREIIAKYEAEAKVHLTQAENLINSSSLQNLLHALYGRLEQNEIPEFKTLLEEMNTYKTIRDEALIKSQALHVRMGQISASNQDSPEYIQLQSEYQYYRSKYVTALSLCGEGEDGLWTISTNKRVPSLYQWLSTKLINAYTAATIKGIHHYIQFYQNKNDKLWKEIYTTYDSYIYEQSYENTDELDSVSLYNQAVAYYEDYNKPSANYTAEVLDLGALEPIALPRLKVGYRIRVYNDYLNLNDDDENNIQFTNNELIITNISYDLRKCQKVSIGVEQVTQYQSILQKLIKTIQ